MSFHLNWIFCISPLRLKGFRALLLMVFLIFGLSSVAAADVSLLGEDIVSNDGLRYQSLGFRYEQAKLIENYGFYAGADLLAARLNTNQNSDSLNGSLLGGYFGWRQQGEQNTLDVKLSGGPSSLYGKVYSFETLGLQSYGFGFFDQFKFHPKFLVQIQLDFYALSDENDKSRGLTQLLYQCEWLRWCRVGMGLEELRFKRTTSHYWSPESSTAYGPLFEVAAEAFQILWGMTVQYRKLTENHFSGESKSLAFSGSQYREGIEQWRFSFQFGRTDTDANHWQGTEFHLSYLF